MPLLRLMKLLGKAPMVYSMSMATLMAEFQEAGFTGIGPDWVR